MITTLLYDTGDQLLYKGISSNYKTIVTDKPTGSKTTNFEFVECKDASGNNYIVVKIGTQTWMAENLRNTSYPYPPGGSVNNVTDYLTWNTTFRKSTPAYCYYDNNPANGIKYGLLYNWYAINDYRGIAPQGWRVASNGDFSNLITFLTENGFNYDGSIVENKSAKSLSSNNLWKESTTLGNVGFGLMDNNRSGFSAMPGGYRGITDQCFGINEDCFFWTSDARNNSNALFYTINYNFNWFSGWGIADKRAGYSIRCIKQ